MECCLLDRLGKSVVLPRAAEQLLVHGQKTSPTWIPPAQNRAGWKNEELIIC